MIKSISVTNPKGETLILELSNPEKSGLIVNKVEGLGPPQADINGSELATADGMYYSSSRAQKRNIVMHLTMYSRDRNSIYGPLSIEESRHLTYVYFPLKKKVRITVVTDSQVLFTDGYIESNEPDIFSQEESCQISIICPDPFWYETGGDKTVFSGVQSTFEFPFWSNLTPGVRENLLKNADFRNPVNSQEKTEYISVSSNAWSIDEWTIEKGTSLYIRDGYIEFVRSPDAGVWNRFHQLFFKPYSISNPITVSLVYASDYDFTVDIEGSAHLLQNSMWVNKSVKSATSPTLVSMGFDLKDWPSGADPDQFYYRFLIGRPVDANISRTAHLELHAIKVEVDEGQTLCTVKPDGWFHYLADDQKEQHMLEFSQIWLDTTAVLEYKGTTDTGILITIHAYDTCDNILIYNVDNDEYMKIDTNKIQSITGERFGAKDDIEISTVKGNRYCRLLRKGVYTNIIGALSRDSDWFQISNGDNAFGFSAESGAENISVTFSYKNGYVGV